jgi:hypothetical protein
MDIHSQIINYMNEQPESKQGEMLVIHNTIMELMPGCKLWFLDGKNSENKVVSNPNIGYGNYTIEYADGTTKEFYQIGLSANTAGISVYIMGIKDKTYLARNFGALLGKASITGYCIKFRSLKEINMNVLKEAIRFGADYANKPNH